MDEGRFSISAQFLYELLGGPAAPILVDVRRTPAFDADEWMIAGAVRRPPEAIERWQSDLGRNQPVVVYCAHGKEVSQEAAASLRQFGFDARYLKGGIGAWVDSRLPMRRKIAQTTQSWVTRERPKIDRIACPWLVSRFINPNAEFIYVPPSDVAKVANDVSGTPYDIKGVEFGHVGDRCSFDAIVRVYDIHDPALDHLATIVRGADTSRPDLTPQCQGLLAISYGLSANFADDHEMLRHGMIVYDALYTWRRLQAETPDRSATATA